MSRIKDRIMTGKRGVVVLTATTIVAAVAVASLTGEATGGEATTTTQPDTESSSEQATAEVTRGDLTNDYEFSGNMSFGDTWALPLQLEGIVTSDRESGDVVGFGDVLVKVGGHPVFLIEGDTPMYRELSVQSDRLEGHDVKQLQRFLIDAGYDRDGALTADGTYGWVTAEAVEDWQEDLGLSETGKVGLTDVVFSPTPLRIEKVPRVGANFDSIEVSETDPVVTVDLEADERDQLPEDVKVEVELSNGKTRSGTVTDQDRVIQEDGSVAWKVTIDPKGKVPSDESTVLVTATVVEASDVLIVPVPALLAVAEGGFAVEVVDRGDTSLVPVEVTDVMDTQAAVTGDVKPGDQVVVPS